MKFMDIHSFSQKNMMMLLLLLSLAFIIFVLANPYFFVSGDTIVLINSVQTILTCLKNGDFDICNHVSHFPLSQHLIGLAFNAVGIRIDQLMSAFQYLNAFAWFSGLLLPLFWWNQPSRRLHLLVYFIIYLSSPLWWYGNTSFNEIVSATLISLFFLSIMYGGCWTALTALLVVLTKEIALAYVLFWTAIVVYLRYRNGEAKLKTVLVSSSTGAILGFTCQAAFNWWRFNSFFNKELLVPLFRTPTWEIKINYFFAQWFAPNVGIIFFWPAFIVLLLAFLLQCNSKIHWTARISVAVFFLSMTFGFSSWFAPFGWIAYGHRLFVPWIPGVSIFLLYAFSDHLTSTLKSATRYHLLPIITKLYILMFTIPSIAILFNLGGINNFFIPDIECPRPAILQTEPQFYFDCIQHYAWEAKWIHFITLSNVNWSTAIFPMITLLLSISFLFIKIDWIVREN